MARGRGDALCRAGDGGEQFDWFLFFGHIYLFPGGHGLVFHHPASAYRWAGSGERRCARTHPIDRARAWLACRGFSGRTDRRVVVLCNRLSHWHRLERAAVGAATAQTLTVDL